MLPLIICLILYLIFLAPEDIPREISRRSSISHFDYEQKHARFNGYIEQFMLYCYCANKGLIEARDIGGIGIGELINAEYRKKHEEEIKKYYKGYYSGGGTFEQYFMHQAQIEIAKRGYENHWEYLPHGLYNEIRDPITGHIVKNTIREDKTFKVYKTKFGDYDAIEGIKLPPDGRDGGTYILIMLFDWKGSYKDQNELEKLINSNRQYKEFYYFLEHGFDGTYPTELPRQNIT